MATPKLKLYVDVVSPFAYLAYWILRVCLYPPAYYLWKGQIADSSFQNDPVFSKCEITYVPMFLGGVMKACGNIAPIKIKSVFSTRLSTFGGRY